MSMHHERYVCLDRLYGTKVRRRWWSVLNWLKGYRYGPVRRCRWCDHTSPTHYPTCRTTAHSEGPA